MGPVPAVAAIRLAVRKALAGQASGGLVLVACSGGADSIALACATAFVAPRMALRFGGVTVDHGLQAGSADQAARVVRFLRSLGYDPVESIKVHVTGPGGPEAAARVARYAALDDAAARLGADAVLLGHTRDDQAETVLLGLARGSGARSLAGMPRRKGHYVRPFLDLPRTTTLAATHAEGHEPWDDPHNTDPAYTRSRVRHAALPALAEALGPGIPEALARTAKMLRDDTEALDAWSVREFTRLLEDGGVTTNTDPGADPIGGSAKRRGDDGGIARDSRDSHDRGQCDVSHSLDAAELSVLPTAIRRRILRLAALRAGCPGSDLAAVHIEAVDALITGWRGQGPLQLPGPVVVQRRYGKLTFERPAPRAPRRAVAPETGADDAPDPEPGRALALAGAETGSTGEALDMLIAAN